MTLLECSTSGRFLLSSKPHQSSRGVARHLVYHFEANSQSPGLSPQRAEGNSKESADRLDTASLLERIASGDERAVQECMDRYGGLVWSICRRLCKNVDDAEDAVQEVFVDLWSSASRFDSTVASEETFVAMIARRRVIDRWRKKRREPKSEVISEITDPSAPTEPDSVEIRDEAARVQSLMTRLRPEQKEILDLSIFGGLSHRDIATELNLPLGTVKTHVRRGLMRVREMLGESSGVSGSGEEAS